MKRFLLLVAIVVAGQLVGGLAYAQQTFLDQGPKWTAGTRASFYAQDQGSRLMPRTWLMALKLPSGGLFMADNLNRYGYLRNDQTPNATLPVGFTTNTDPQGTVYVGMTCAACHTRQIEVKGVAYRVDGGPAIVEFQSFLQDLHDAVQNVLNNPAAFDDFAAGVLGSGASPDKKMALRTDLQIWYTPYDAIISRSLPTPAWGPSRLDAVQMIFNRLSGLDIGPANSGPNQGHMIVGNIKRADAPTRYPFLWNASIQDKTQWPGFAPNGDDVLAMIRNVGEVLGVFGHLYPTKDALGLPRYEDNSVNIDGLLKLETLISEIGPPKSPFGWDQTLAAQGAEIYKWSEAQGAGCEGCHGIKPGTGLGRSTWATPVLSVGTDTRELTLLKQTADTGVLKGAALPHLAATASSVDILAASVIGIMAPKLGHIAEYDVNQSFAEGGHEELATRIRRLPGQTAQIAQLGVKKTPVGAYESRVMQGIWAAAPYLHNGSVPTLWDLLQPVAQRPTSFKIGPNYDPTGKVGLAAEQTKFNYTLRTGCSDINSGNSNCGHEFGTRLTPDQKKALLEYLKTL